MISQLAQLLIATLVAGTPLVYAALGELVVERAGVLNMGVEGMMVTGAISAFAVTMATGSVTLGVIVAMAAAMALSLLFSVLAISFRANQVAVGLALTIFGTSLGSYIGKSYVGMALVVAPSPLAAFFARIPLLGQLHPLVWLSWILFGATWYFLYRTKAGLALRAVGESPASAHAIGYPVIRIRYLATLFGGALAGIAGAYVSLVYTALWTEGSGAGRVRDLAAGTLHRRRLSVRRRDHGAALRPKRGRRPAAGIDVGAALHRDHRGPRAHFPKRDADAAQRAGLTWKAVHPVGQAGVMSWPISHGDTY